MNLSSVEYLVGRTEAIGVAIAGGVGVLFPQRSLWAFQDRYQTPAIAVGASSETLFVTRLAGLGMVALGGVIFQVFPNASPKIKRMTMLALLVGDAFHIFALSQHYTDLGQNAVLIQAAATVGLAAARIWYLLEGKTA